MNAPVRRRLLGAAVTVTLVLALAPASALAQAMYLGADVTTRGNWQGTYGNCGYILSGTGTPTDPPRFEFQMPTVEFSGNNPNPFDTCYDLDLQDDGNTANDVTYKVYTPPFGSNDYRVLESDIPDGPRRAAMLVGTAQPVSVNPPASCQEGAPGVVFNDVPPGRWQVAVYLLDYEGWENRKQNVNVVTYPAGSPVCFTTQITAPKIGHYAVFIVDVGVNRLLEVRAPRVTTNSNAIVNGIFLDDASMAGATGPAGIDMATAGNWDQPGAAGYGDDGYVLFQYDMPNVAFVEPPLKTYDRRGGLFTDALDYNYVTGCQGRAATQFTPVMSSAFAYLWALCTTRTDVLQLPTSCGGSQACPRRATTWDDAGERNRYGTGPDLHTDVFIPAGEWRLAIFADDFDNHEGGRTQKIRIHDPANMNALLAQSPVALVGLGRYELFKVTGPGTITVVAEGTNAASNSIVSGLFFDRADGGACNEPPAPTCETIVPGQFCSYTQAAWGTDPPCQGNNVACLIANNWGAVYGNNGLAVGVNNQLLFPQPCDVQAFLPNIGPPGVLAQDIAFGACAPTPGAYSAGILGAEITALKLNVDFADAGILDIDPIGALYGDLTIVQGSFAGLTVRVFLDLAEQVLGSAAALPPNTTLQDFVAQAVTLNMNFSMCNTNLGHLQRGCQGPGTSCTYDLQISKSLLTGPLVEVNGLASFLVTVTNPLTPTNCTVTNVVLSDVLPVVPIGNVNQQAFYNVVAIPPANVFQNGYLQWNIGNLMPGGTFVVTLNVQINPQVPVGTTLTNQACVAGSQVVQACDQAHVEVVQQPLRNDAGEDIGTPGFWCNQLARVLDARCEKGNSCKFDQIQFDAWLSEIKALSSVFPEKGQASTLAAARTLICNSSSKQKPAFKLQRHLLALWFNVVGDHTRADRTLESLCGAGGWPSGTDPCWTIGYVIEQAEEALCPQGNCGSTANNNTLLFWKDVIDIINNAQDPEFGNCNNPDTCP